jgi:SIR2-like domain
MTAPVESPYKFLDAYETNDRDRFFGRDPEINILLADIVTARLVVLFARTGTGKTSLINAGVMPALHDRDYATFYIRVEKDPVASARTVIAAEHPELPRSDAHFSQQLRDLAKRLARPIVLFFDQFEEFFLFVAADEPERARAFVAEIANVFDDPDSGVHIVFSMREEFFVELELFRDLIPSIYHTDSNLRLKHLRLDQARAAIVGPAKNVGIEIDDYVVDAIVHDLSQSQRGEDDDLIEPAQLQIVCDALWAGAADGHIDAEDYRALGRNTDGGSVAHAILYERVRKELQAIDDEGELDVAARLLPLLRTDRHTKWTRDVADLMQLLQVDEDVLCRVLGRLVATRVIEFIVRDRMDAVELTHDYLVEHLDALVDRVRAIWPQRMLRQAVARYHRTGAPATLEELHTIAGGLDHLDLELDKDEAREAACLLFLFALKKGRHGLAVFDYAQRHGLDLGELFSPALQPASALETSRAAKLLVDVIENRPRARDKSFGLIQGMLDYEHESAEAQHALATVAASADSGIANTAKRMLLDFLRKTSGTDNITPAALATLEDTRTLESVELLERILRSDDPIIRQGARRVLQVLAKLPDADVAARAWALIRTMLNDKHRSAEAQHDLGALAASTNVQTADTAKRMLLDFFKEASGTESVTPAALDALKDIGTLESVEVLEQILLGDDQVGSEDARSALLDLAEGPASDVAAHADRILAETRTPSSSVAGTKSPPGARDFQEGHSPEVVSSDVSRALELVADGVHAQESILFLGPGVHAPPPANSPFQYPPEQRPPIGTALSLMLAAECDFATRFPYDDPGNLQRVALAHQIDFSRARLVNTVDNAMHVGKVPSPMLRALARLDFPVVITTNYDQLFEKALKETGKQPRVAIYTPELQETTDFRKPTAQSPIVFKIHGDISRPETVVITDEDHIEFLLRMRDPQPYDPVPSRLKVYLSDWTTLFVGYSLQDYNLRLLFKTLRRKIDNGDLPDMYSVDFAPDPLIMDVWQSQRRYVKFIVQDVWTFVPRLHELVAGTELSP